jgi:hypothetical protein
MALSIPSILDTAKFRHLVLDGLNASLASSTSNSFNIPAYDRIDLSNYTGANPGTVVYKSGGNTVATLTLTWSGDNLTSVVRS